jgi:DNA polymerase
MAVVHIDLETRSALPLDRVSTYRYASEESTEILCVAYAVADGPIELWTPGAPVPDAVTAANTFVAHNAGFEHAVINHLLVPRFGWPAIPIARFTCTMARARAAALPGSLDGAAAALGLVVRKDKAGAKLMKEIASRKWEPTPEDLARLYAYCRQDVEVERELDRWLPPLTEPEQALWVLDHEINRRGIPIDRQLAIAVADLAKQQRIAINAEIEALTGGKITTANQRDRILAWVTADGCEIESLTKADVKKALENGASDGARKLLGLRAIGSQAAAAKVKTLLVGLDDDDRLRETLVFHGSAPGRWSGRRFQPQNLKKPAKTLDVDAAIAAIKSGELGRVEALGHPLSIAADVSRGLICARPGHVLIGADFSAIESRVLAWLAGEKWKLDAYRQFDKTADPTAEPYCQIASKILGRAVTPDDKDGRDLGKVADLAGGFGGSVGAWRKFKPDDARSDDAIKSDINAFRRAHPQTVRFAIAYPKARLVDGKFEHTIDIAFKDNAMGKWREVTEWYGTFVENAVQATARDLLAAALVRLEAAGFPIVAHVHDEAIAELPEGADRRAEFVAVMTEAPPWADGLPIAGKAWCGQRFVKSDRPAAAAEDAEPATEDASDDASWRRWAWSRRPIQKAPRRAAGHRS